MGEISRSKIAKDKRTQLKKAEIVYRGRSRIARELKVLISTCVN
jgi:hypothetical protein